MDDLIVNMDKKLSSLKKLVVPKAEIKTTIEESSAAIYKSIASVNNKVKIVELGSKIKNLENSFPSVALYTERIYGELNDRSNRRTNIMMFNPPNMQNYQNASNII